MKLVPTDEFAARATNQSVALLHPVEHHEVIAGNMEDGRKVEMRQ